MIFSNNYILCHFNISMEPTTSIQLKWLIFQRFTCVQRSRGGVSVLRISDLALYVKVPGLGIKNIDTNQGRRTSRSDELVGFYVHSLFLLYTEYNFVLLYSIVILCMI